MNVVAPHRFDGKTEAAVRSQGYLALDLLRGMAALVVFLCHIRGAAFVEYGALPASDQTPLAAIAFALTRLGHEAVMAFFVLSGFLVGGPAAERAFAGTFNPKAYAIDRATRIFVPLVPACVLTVVISGLAFGTAPDWFQFGMNIFGLNNILGSTLPNNAPLWSLAYEIWFYVFAGAAAAILSKRTPDAIALLALMSAFVVLSCSGTLYPLIWCFGAATTCTLASSRKGALAVAGLACFLIGSTAYQAATASHSFTSIAMMPIPISELLVSAGICLALPFLCTAPPNASLIPFKKPIQALSRMSYSLYLIHYPLNCALDLWLPKASGLSLLSFAAFFIRGALVFGGSVVFYLCFEAHTCLIRRALKRRTGVGRTEASC
jgi:peptidoglycan/LPS O-acetylase OafA/YrhL